MKNNLLISLHSLCKREDENFITESFVNLLRIIIDLDPKSSIPLLNYITNKQWNGDHCDIGSIQINSQVTINTGRPDIEIIDAKHLFLIEVKVESGFGENQIKKYSNYLNSFSNKKTSLITITKNKTVKDPSVEHSIRWYNIHLELLGIQTENTILKHSIEQFISFMLYRGLFMDTVKPEITSGINSFKNLMGMLNEILSRKYLYKKGFAWEWYGFYIDNSKYWVGIVLNNPGILLFHTESLDLSDTLEVDKGVVRNSRWENTIDFSVINKDFFMQSQENQIITLENFLDISIEYAEILNRRHSISDNVS